VCAESKVTANIKRVVNNVAKLSRNLSRVNVGCRQKNSKALILLYTSGTKPNFFSLPYCHTAQLLF